MSVLQISTLIHKNKGELGHKILCVESKQQQNNLVEAALKLGEWQSRGAGPAGERPAISYGASPLGRMPWWIIQFINLLWKITITGMGMPWL